MEVRSPGSGCQGGISCGRASEEPENVSYEI